MTEVTVIKANLNDAKHRQAVLRGVAGFSDSEGSGARALDPTASEGLIDFLESFPTTKLFLAYSGDEFVGLAACFLGFSTFAAKPNINVHDLFVEPSYRGQGIGTKLLEAVEEEARKKGYCAVTLEVLVSKNPGALKLYKNFGFEVGDYYACTKKLNV